MIPNFRTVDAIQSALFFLQDVYEGFSEHGTDLPEPAFSQDGKNPVFHSLYDARGWRVECAVAKVEGKEKTVFQTTVTMQPTAGDDRDTLILRSRSDKPGYFEREMMIAVAGKTWLKTLCRSKDVGEVVEELLRSQVGHTLWHMSGRIKYAPRADEEAGE